MGRAAPLSSVGILSFRLKMPVRRARDFEEDPKKFAAQSLPDSYREVAEMWIKRHVEANGLRSEREYQRILNKYIVPKWGDRKFLDIRRGEINVLLDHVSDRHGRFQADSVLKVISGICRFYETRNEHYKSPIVKGMKRSKKSDEKERFLNNDEIKQVWNACTQFGTFGRLGQVCTIDRATTRQARVE